MALSCVFGVAACAPADDKGNTGAVTPGGDQPGGTELPGGTEQPGGDEQDPGGEETPEPAPEPSEGLEFELITEDSFMAEYMADYLFGQNYAPCYMFIGIGSCSDTDVVIPSEYNGLAVRMAFLDELSGPITSLYFPDSIVTITTQELYAPELPSLTDIRLPRNQDTIVSVAWENCAFYQDPDNWEDGALYMNDWLLATNEELSTDYIVKAGTYGIAGMAFLDAYYSVFPAPPVVENISRSNNISRSESNGSHVERVTLPDSVKALQAAFMNCQSLKEVVLPDDILTIGSAAFFFCLGLTEISIPKSVTRINYSALWGCSNLTAITVPDSVTIIDDLAFDGCEKLTSIVIPDSVTAIDDVAFQYCDNLTTVYYTGSQAEWKQIEIGSRNDELLNAKIVFNYKGE